MKEILPGIYHWTAFHKGIGFDVSSYFVVASATLIDPMMPPDGLRAFADVGEPERIVLTCRHHYRGSDRFVEAFGCPVLCPEPGLHEFEGGPDVQGYAWGEEVAPGITALEVGSLSPDDGALQIPAVEALAFADGLVHWGGGQVGFVPDQYMGDDPEAVKKGLRESLDRLLDLDYDNLLFGHGEPIVGGGRQALHTFLHQ